MVRASPGEGLGTNCRRENRAEVSTAPLHSPTPRCPPSGGPSRVAPKTKAKLFNGTFENGMSIQMTFQEIARLNGTDPRWGTSEYEVTFLQRKIAGNKGNDLGQGEHHVTSIALLS